MKDEKTAAYFDSYKPHFNPKRFQFALDLLRSRATPDQRLIDVGCGDGATLAMIRAGTPLERLAGLDVSAEQLRRLSENLGCETIHGSILDEVLVARLEGTFDYCTLGAVLHHLIARTRSQSRQDAETCIGNSLRLLKPDGYLLLFEPTFTPQPLMDLVFWIKKAASSVSSARIEVGRSWLNFGEPVVSYYSVADLDGMLTRSPTARVEQRLILGETRLGVAIKRTDLGLVVRRAAKAERQG